MIQQAARFAKAAHESIDQRRKYSNEPYIVHPQAVAALVSTVTDDYEMICAAWLHDTVEDTPVTIEQIEAGFGTNIAALVDDLTDVSTDADGDWGTRLAIDREHTSRASQRAKTIKLADVIDNLSGVVQANARFAKRFVREKESLLAVLEEGHLELLVRARRLIGECKSELLMQESSL